MASGPANVAARIARNSFLCFLAQAIDWVLRAIYLIIVARYLTQADFGFYNFAFSLGMILAALSNMGLETLLVREISRDKDKTTAYFGQALLFTIVTMVVAVGATAGVLQLISATPERRLAFLLMAVGFFFRRSCQLLLSVPRAHEHMEYDIVFSAFEGVGLLCFLLLTISLHLGPMAVFVTFAAAYALEFVVGLVLVTARFVRSPWQHLSMQGIWKMVSMAVPMGVANVATIINTSTGSLLLPLLAGEAQAGVYGAAYSFIKGLFLIPRSLQVGMLPVFSRIFVTARDGMERSLERLLKLVLIVVLAVAIPTAILARHILSLLYADKYVEATSSLQVISITVVFLFLNLILIGFLYATDHQRIVGWSVGLALVVSLGLLVAFGPSHGSLAAAIAQLAAEVTVFVLNTAAIARDLARRPSAGRLSWLRIAGKPALAAVAMTAVLLAAPAVIGSSTASPWLYLAWGIVGLAVYVIALVAVRVLDTEEVGMTRALAHRALERVRSSMHSRRLAVGPTHE